MTTRRLAIECEPVSLWFSSDLAIREPRKSSHLGRDDDRIFVTVGRGWKRQRILSFTPGFNKLPGNIPSDLQRFGYRSPLRHQSR